ncbi:hypothetical protein LOTGIDRAFT_102666, partial [Lottia gigantea]
TESGTIQSPNFPNLYPQNAVCDWTVEAPEDKIIILTFNYFDVSFHPIHYILFSSDYNCEFDFVVIYDGDKEIAVYCGSPIPDPVTSTTNKLRITFISDDQYEYEGFNATYSMKGKQDLIKL